MPAVAAGLLLLLLTAPATAQVPYNQCGTIVQGTACMFIFHDDQGQDWLLDSVGGFGIGAQVRVTGSADPSCITSCMQGGCIAVSTIGPCLIGAPFCFGDGTATPCPCGNDSPAGQGRGCLSSLGVGALLTATGNASVAADDIVLSGSGMPDSTALYYQGLSQFMGGLGAVFGDGLRCVGGTIVRLGLATNSGGTSQYPEVGDAPVSVHGGVQPGDVRRYQVWYRNAANFCTMSTFNLSNGLELTWGP